LLDKEADDKSSPQPNFKKDVLDDASFGIPRFWPPQQPKNLGGWFFFFLETYFQPKTPKQTP